MGGLLAFVLLSLLGVRGFDLYVGVLMAGAPAAMATYIMAQQMKGDAELSGSIVLMSTALLALSYSIALLLLRAF